MNSDPYPLVAPNGPADRPERCPLLGGQAEVAQSLRKGAEIDPPASRLRQNSPAFLSVLF
jgi:hypothetical protein